jgi:hypothetical protein
MGNFEGPGAEEPPNTKRRDRQMPPLSRRVVEIEKAMLELEVLGKMCREGLHAVAFCRVMPCGEVIHPELSRLVRRLLGDLSTEKSVDAEVRCLQDVPLPRTGTPSEGFDRPPPEARSDNSH